MTRYLLGGVVFKAEVRPNNTITWSWGRPGLRLANKNIVDNNITRALIATLEKQLNYAMSQKVDNVVKAKMIKDSKDFFVETVSMYEISEINNG